MSSEILNVCLEFPTPKTEEALWGVRSLLEQKLS